MPSIMMSPFAVLIVVVAAIVVPHIAQAMDGSCVPMKSMPDLDAMSKKVKNVASAEGRVVANMVGAVHLVEDNSYLPLDINSVSLSDQPGHRNVTLHGSCTQFRIDVAKWSKDTYNYKNLEMFIKNDASGDKSFKKICEFSPKFDLEHSNEWRYSCTMRWSHKCFHETTGELVAKLDLVSFELELDSDQAAWRQFGRKPYADSCSKWWY